MYYHTKKCYDLINLLDREDQKSAMVRLGAIKEALQDDESNDSLDEGDGHMSETKGARGRHCQVGAREAEEEQAGQTIAAASARRFSSGVRLVSGYSVVVVGFDTS